MPFDWAKHWYNIYKYDQANAFCWVLGTILFRRLCNMPHANMILKSQKELQIFKLLSEMSIALTIGSLVNELSYTADKKEWWASNTLWGILIITYFVVIITIFYVKIKKIGRLKT